MKLGWRLFWRDWRSGELGVLLLALVLSVTIVTTLALFVDRLQRAIELRSAAFLAGDLVLRATHPVPAGWLEAARQHGLHQAMVMRFASMALHGDALQLVSVKAVSANYPLIGAVSVSDSVGAPTQQRAHGPPRGEVWVDARLLPLLGIMPGDNLGLGATELRVGGILQDEPDGSSSLIALGPRLMMHIDDIAATGVVQPGSRLQYAYLFTGGKLELSAWRADIEPQLQPGQRFLTIADGQRNVANSLERARSFLLLAGSLGVVLAGVALAMASRRYAERHADYVAMLKTLGLAAGAIRRLYLGNLVLLATVGTLLGWVLAWSLQAAAFVMMREYLMIDVPTPGGSAFVLGAGTGVVSLLGLAAPQLMQMAAVSPLRVLRRDVGPSFVSGWLYLGGGAGLALLLLWYSGDPLLSLVVLTCALSAGLVIGGTAFWILRSARRPGLHAHGALRLALAGLQRHAALNALQVLIFAVTLMLLLVMVLVRSALLDDWQRQLPPRTPNHFLVNIAPHQVAAVEEFLAARGFEHAGLVPMVPGRLDTVNGKPAHQENNGDMNLDRDLNLSWAAELPAGNRLVDGVWWHGDASNQVSVEAGFAKALGIRVGDKLGLRIGGDRLEARVANIRELNWDTMRPNFFLILPAQLLRSYPSTWITSFYLPAGRKLEINALNRQFPTLTILEMDAFMDQVRGLTRQLSHAVELVLVLLLVAGSLVMVASVQSGLDARFQESAILRALGASRRVVLGSLVLEFGLLGLFAGTLATLGAEIAAWYVQTRLMEIAFVWHPVVWIAGPLAGMAIASALGLASCRRVVNTPPIWVLRELS